MRTCVKDNMFMVAGEITVAEKMDHKTVVRGVMPSIEFDSFMDDLSSVGGKGLKHQLEMDTMCADERDDQVETDSFELETAVSPFGVLNGDITQKQQQHKHDNFHSKQRQKSGRTEEEEKEERERRKGEREKEDERDAEEEEREQVKKDVTGWTVVTRNKKQRKRHMRTARGRRRIWRAARRAAEQARDEDMVEETRSFAEEAEKETWRRRKGETDKAMQWKHFAPVNPLASNNHSNSNNHGMQCSPSLG